MRTGRKTIELRGIYDRVAKHYDLQHAFLTWKSDQRGRELLVEKAVSVGDHVLDCGAGTGTTALLAAQKIGPSGEVVLLDVSEDMLKVAKEKATQANLRDRLEIEVGDMLHLPFEDDRFNAVLSTYSLCPLYDPAQGARELYRVTNSGGRIGVAHSTEPAAPWVKWLADKVERMVWRFPSISLGCRPVSVLPTLESLGCKTTFRRQIGVPLWPFLVFVVEKPRT